VLYDNKYSNRTAT